MGEEVGFEGVCEEGVVGGDGSYWVVVESCGSFTKLIIIYNYSLIQLLNSSKDVPQAHTSTAFPYGSFLSTSGER